jgi:hypothetical protein
MIKRISVNYARAAEGHWKESVLPKGIAVSLTEVDALIGPSGEFFRASAPTNMHSTHAGQFTAGNQC